jgi:predicted alpha/beta-fold hydrolase
LEKAAGKNEMIDLWLTQYGGHVGYISSSSCQRQNGDNDYWWAWNRILDWCDGFLQ